MFPKSSELSNYTLKMYDFAKRFSVESESALFNTKKTGKRPSLNFYRFVMKNYIALNPERFINQPFFGDIPAKYECYFACTDSNKMVGGACVFSYNLMGQSFVQLGESVSTFVYFTVCNNLKGKGIGSDLLLAVFNDCTSKKAKFYIVNPTTDALSLVKKFGLEDVFNDSTYYFDFSKKNNIVEQMNQEKKNIK